MASPWYDIGRYALKSLIPGHSPLADLPSMADYKSAGRDVVTTAKNIIPDTAHVVKDMVTGTAHVIAHPINTLGGLGQLGGSAYEAAFPTKGLSPAQHAQRVAPIKAAWGTVADPWSTVDPVTGQRHWDSAKAHETITQHPGTALLDLATVLPMGGGALKGLGAAADLAGAEKTADFLGTTGNVLSTVGNAANPVALAGKTVGAPLSLARHYWELQSGVPATFMQEAERAGRAGGQTEADFNKFRFGQGMPQDIHRKAIGAIQAIKKDASDNYLQGRAGVANQPVDMTPIFQSLQDQRARLGKGASLGFTKAKSALDDAENLVFDVAINPDPAARTIDNIDTLKQQLYDLHDSHTNNQASNVINSVYHATRNAMSNVDPNYTDLMENYQTHLNNLNDLQKTLGASAKVNPTTAVTRMLRQMRNPMGQSLVRQLAEKEPSLLPMLAGASMQSAVAPTLMEKLGAIGTIGGGVAGAITTGNPYLLVPPAVSAVAQSPRLAGALNYNLGRLQRLSDVTGVTPVLKAADALTPDLPQAMAIAGEGERIKQQQPQKVEDIFKPEFYSGDSTDQPSVQGAAPMNYEDIYGNSTEDRQGHKDGGSVGHQHLVDRLMSLAHKAKRETDQATKPLLKADDSSIAQALAVANRGI